MAAKYPRLDIVRNSETKQFYWKLFATNGMEQCRSSETYSRLSGATKCAAVSLGLAETPTLDGVAARLGFESDNADELDAGTGVNIRFLLRANEGDL